MTKFLDSLGVVSRRRSPSAPKPASGGSTPPSPDAETLADMVRDAPVSEVKEWADQELFSRDELYDAESRGRARVSLLNYLDTDTEDNR